MRTLSQPARLHKDELIKIFSAAPLLLCGLFGTLLQGAHAQAKPAATQSLHLSAFGGATGTYTGFGGGRNVGITAGADLGFRPFHSFFPSLEIRGTYPVAKGKVDSQRNFLGGLQIAREYGRYHPYIDFLFGRGQINYNPGFVNVPRTLYYTQSVTNVFSPGLGVDIDLTDHFAFKADAQLQRYSIPVTTMGSIYAKAGTLGLVYRFDFNHTKHHIPKQPAPIQPALAQPASSQPDAVQPLPPQPDPVQPTPVQPAAEPAAASPTT